MGLPLDATSGSMRRDSRDSRTLPRVSVSLETQRAAGAGPRARWTVGDWFLGTTEGQWTALGIVAACLLLLGTWAWSLTGGNEAAPSDFRSSLWMSYGLFIDPGTQTGLSADDLHIIHIVAVMFSICGFIFNLSMLGLVVDLIRGALNRWKELRNRVVANGHTLILGWGDKTLFLLTELLAAYEKEPPDRSCRRFCCCCRRNRRQVVLLAKCDVLDMRQEVQLHLETQGIAYGHRIIYRQGDPTDRSELMKVSAASADDILIMGKRVARDSDQGVIQTLLALAALFSSESRRFAGDVFAEIRTQASVNVCQDVLEEAEPIMARRAVNWMLCLRGLVKNVGFCYMDMVCFKSVNELSFKAGNEVYLRPVPPELYGTPFREVYRLFPDAVVFGLQAEEGKPLIPKRGCLLGEGDHLVMLARNSVDADRISHNFKLPRLQGNLPTIPPCLQEDGQLRLGPSTEGPKTVIVIGCPTDMVEFLLIMDDLLAAGSTVHILSLKGEEWRRQALAEGEDEALNFVRITVQTHVGCTMNLRHLASLPLNEADTILILSEANLEDEDPLAIDSRSLTTIISLRSVSENLWRAGQQGMKKNCKIVTELLDPKSEQVLKGHAKLRRHGSYFYSNAIETGVFAMAAEDKRAYNILMQLLDPRSGAGDVIAVPMWSVTPGYSQLSFFDLHALVAEACGGVLLGWRRSDSRYPELNPTPKNEPLSWDSCGVDDELLVLRPAEWSSEVLESTLKRGGPALTPSARDGNYLPPGCCAPLFEKSGTLPSPC